MKHLVILVLSLATTLACGLEPWPPETVARWNNGRADLARIEALFTDIPKDRQSGEPLVELYQDTARELCVRDILLRKAAESGEDIASTTDRELVRRQLTVRAWVTEEVLPTIEVTEAEIEAFFNDNPGLSHRPERRMVSHIFRRVDQPSDAEAVLSTLTAAHDRALSGESFEALARELSDSETRDVRGVLGWVERGQLQQEAEDVVFNLQENGVSMPIEVRGGFAIFKVSQIFGEQKFPLDDVRQQLTQQLAMRKTAESAGRLADTTELPINAGAVSEDELMTLLESGKANDVVYHDADVKLTLADWRERLVGGTADQQRGQWAEFLQTQRAYSLALSSGYLDDEGQREAIEESVHTAIDQRLATRIIVDRMRNSAEHDSDALQRWYEENRDRYQTPLELHIDHLISPFDSDPEELGRKLRSIAAEYDGDDLETAAATLNGAETSRQWVPLSALDRSHPRVKAALADLQPPGCAPVFHFDKDLHLLCVGARNEPQLQTFDEARTKLIDDFVAAHEQAIYASIKDEILSQANFEFNEAYVRDLLRVPPESEE